MRTKSIAIIVAVSGVTLATGAFAQTVIFSDDFETPSFVSPWVQGASSLAISSAQNAVPGDGMYSAYADLSADRMWHNIGSELSGRATFSFWLYDDTMTRAYGQALAYSGAGYNDGTLQQLFAVGKYNAVTLLGEVHNPSKYQGRFLYPSGGWFNLDLPGTPDRSTGWHKFTIEQMFDGTTINFYVDDVLGRSFAGATTASWDSISLGFGTASATSNGNAWYDGVVVSIPEPTSLALSLLGGLGLWIVRRRR